MEHATCCGSSMSSASTSRVTRGRPRTPAATPPIITPRTEQARNQDARSRSVARSRARGSVATGQGLSNLAPTSAYLFGLGVELTLPSHRLRPGHQLRHLAKLHPGRRTAQLAL